MNSILRWSLLCFVLVFSVSKSIAQCAFSYPFNPQTGISNYTLAWQHAPGGVFEYCFQVTAGTTYEWSLCSEDGANNGPEFTGAQNLAFSDSLDFNETSNFLPTRELCGSGRERITWVAEYTGVVYIQPFKEFCFALYDYTDLMYRAYNCNGITNVGITSSSNTVCQGATVTLSLPTLPIGSSIQWLINGVEIPFATTNTYYTNQANAFYSATVSLPGTSCAAQNTNTILLQDFSADIRSTTSAGVSINPVICDGTPIILDAYEGNAISYEWIYNGNPISNANTSSYNVTQSGEYTVSIGFQGCTANDTVQVTSGQTPPTPLITPSGIPTFCQGGSVLLDGSSLTGYTYQWQLNGASIPLATYNTFLADSSGEYALTIVNVEGCQASSNSIVVTVNPCVGFDLIQNESIHVYPNPVMDQLHVEIPAQHTFISLTILDMQGRPVLNPEVKIGDTILQFSAKNIAKGMYQLVLKTDKAQFVKRIIISTN